MDFAPVVRLLLVLFVNALVSQFLFWLKTIGLLPLVPWGLVQIIAGSLLFYLCLHYFDWDQAVLFALAVATGVGLGVVAGL